MLKGEKTKVTGKILSWLFHTYYIRSFEKSFAANFDFFFGLRLWTLGFRFFRVKALDFRVSVF